MEYDWDFAGGEDEYKKALELDSNDATAHQWYALDIGWIGGREQEAIAEINRAHQLDPLSPIISSRVGSVQIWARRYDEGIVSCKKVASENPTKQREDDWFHIPLAQVPNIMRRAKHTRASNPKESQGTAEHSPEIGRLPEGCLEFATKRISIRVPWTTPPNIGHSIRFKSY